MITTEFDLKGLAVTVPDVASVRRTHWVSLAMSVMFACLAAIALAAYFLYRGLLSGGNLAGGMAICAIFAVAGSAFYIKTGPGPESLRVDQQGLTFVYESGRTERISWTRPGLQLRIEKTSGFVRRGVPRPAMAVVIGGTPSRKYITLAALEEITQQASSAGLNVSEEASEFPGFTRVTVRRS